jgi:hypothetical protein
MAISAAETRPNILLAKLGMPLSEYHILPNDIRFPILYGLSVVHVVQRFVP